MRNFLLLITIVLIKTVNAQSTFTNTGNVEIHKGGQIGFHIDLKNDGLFASKNGLAGFYSNDDTIYVYGENTISFYNMEVSVEKDLQVFTSIEIRNEKSFINGRIITPREDKEITISFSNDAIYAGENNKDYIDGYASVRSDIGFTFPIGDANRLRTATIDNNTNAQEFKAAYFFEDANYSTTLNTSFDTTTKDNSISEVSTVEFWDIDGQAPVNVTLTWDANSNIADMTSNVNNLVVVGWSRIDREWKNLGRVEVAGDLYTGSVKSTTIFPDDYEALTIATQLNNNTNKLDNNAAIIKTNVFDVSGRLVRTFGADEAINFSGVAKGVYITDVYLSNGKRYSKKVLN